MKFYVVCVVKRVVKRPSVSLRNGSAMSHYTATSILARGVKQRQPRDGITSKHHDQLLLLRPHQGVSDTITCVSASLRTFWQRSENSHTVTPTVCTVYMQEHQGAKGVQSPKIFNHVRQNSQKSLTRSSMQEDAHKGCEEEPAGADSSRKSTIQTS